MALGKKRVVLLALALLLALPSSWAYYYTIYPQCSSNPCISGQPMNWTVEIFNDGKRKIEYVTMEIVDGKTQDVLANWEVEFNPLSSERGDVIPILPGHKINVTMPSLTPKQHLNNRFSYYPCFTITILDTLTLAKYGEYENRHCFIENESMYVLDCIYNEHCKASEHCGGNRCLTLRCQDCQYIANHSCVNYECCADDQCTYNSQCVNRSCTPIQCTQTQYLFNRTCMDIQCEQSEILVNRTCIPLNCSAHEGFVNHSCQPLSCADNQHIVDHRCVPLDCLESEYPSNHSCMQLSCREDQGFRDHSCYDLDCYPFQNIDNHTCINNTALILKLSAEIIILILIILFIILDVVKYRNRKKGKTTKTSLQDELSTSSLQQDMNKLAKK